MPNEHPPNFTLAKPVMINHSRDACLPNTRAKSITLYHCCTSRQIPSLVCTYTPAEPGEKSSLIINDIPLDYKGSQELPGFLPYSFRIPYQCESLFFSSLFHVFSISGRRILIFYRYRRQGLWNRTRSHKSQISTRRFNGLGHAH